MQIILITDEGIQLKWFAFEDELHIYEQWPTMEKKIGIEKIFN